MPTCTLVFTGEGGNKGSVRTANVASCRCGLPLAYKGGVKDKVKVGSRGDVASLKNNEGMRMVISKETTWEVDFEDQVGRPGWAT